MNIKTNYEEKRNEEKNGIELYFEEIPTPEERKQQYIERLKRYFKRYGQHVHARGYWVNR